MTETVWLQRPSEDVPWGFRLNGGVDCEKPLTVQRVSLYKHNEAFYDNNYNAF